ncbi:ATP-binding cassette domain-containing protein [Serratia quinivorans]|uniref:ATP-binding cassette domain-containing protein n=1 Tax=Serratia quinivorans TaxID=137545 RepID=UPI0039064A4E
MNAEPLQSAPLRAEHLTLGYDKKIVASDLSVSIPHGELTVIIGPNACGKSTLLRTLSRLMQPQAGAVWLNGKHISEYATKEVARQLGLLPQSSTAPGDITVFDLVARGRYPHQRLFSRWSEEDQQAVDQAMRSTGVFELAEQPVDTLSGGQRQRVWIAMVLAQQTPLLLLDEPTTWLDITHQIDLLELMRQLNRENSHTLVVVLHDLNHACRYATHLIAMRDGKVVAEGAPKDIVTAELIEEVYGLRCMIIDDPVSHTPLVVPLGKS